MMRWSSLKTSSLRTGLTTSLIFIIFVLSFRSFALYLAPVFHSDHMVQVLMAQDLVLPEDLYYWGQNRLGSLVPILAHGLIQGFSIAPILAISGVQYFLILWSFLCFSSLLKQNISKLIFALICFLPIEPFGTIVEVGHPYSPQFAMIGSALVLSDRLAHHSPRPAWKSGLLIIGCLVSLILSLWISELSMILVAIVGYFVFYECCYYDRTSKARTSEARTSEARTQPLSFTKLFTLMVIVGLAFMIIAKLSATASYGIFKINHPFKILFIVKSIMNWMFASVSFSINNLFLSLHTIFGLVLTLGFAGVFTKGSIDVLAHQRHRRFPFDVFLDPVFTSKFKYAILFAINAVGSLILLINSEWVYRNEVSSRYFGVVYLSVWLAIIFYLEALDQRPNLPTIETSELSISMIRRLERGFAYFKQPILGALLLLATIGALSLAPSVFSFSRSPSQYGQMKAFQQLAPAGVIGDYWMSYVICGVDPAKLHCTPHDQSMVRSQRSVQKVLRSPKIYLVKEKWLDRFPDRITQFNQSLKRTGPEIKISNYTLAPYEIIH